VLGVQEPLYRKTRTAAWVDSAAVEDEHAHLRLHLAQLPQETCLPLFRVFALLAIVGDERDKRGKGPKGARRLVCSLCSHAWQFPRSTCPSCGESRVDQLRSHVTDFWPHLRVEECVSCKTYLKAVDVRADRGAVPVVDELASVELDLWAADEGLEKLHRNLLGL